MKKTLFFLCFVSANIIHSQVTVNLDTPPNLIQNVLIGNGVSVSNITSQGSPEQFASFTAAPGTPIDFSSGIVLSTFGMTAPNCMQVGGPGYFGAGTPGDADLSATAGGGGTTDASWIQFDFIPTGDTMRFDYIFGSVEYNGFVNTQYNDVFAFYLTGPNPLGGSYTSQNVAIIPGTALPVTINNLNNGNAGGCSSGPCEYCSYFIDNCNPPVNGIVTGGYTTNLQVVVPVVPCSTYTIKLGVADLIDQGLNSFVMLKANSFVSNQVTISQSSNLLGVDTVVASDSVFYEGCTYTEVYFVRGGDLLGTDTVVFTVGGTAIMGTDYNSFSDTLIFLPGVDTITITVQPLEDALIESMESITISITDTICNNPVTTTFSLYINDLDVTMDIFAGNDSLLCPGVPFVFDAFASGGANIFGIQWQGPGNNTWADDSTFQVTSPGYYSVSIYEYCLDTTQYDSLYLDILQMPTASFNNYQACSGEPINIGVPAVSGYNMTWTPGTNLNSTTLSNPVFSGINGSPTPQVFNYVIQLDSAGYQCFSDSVTVTLYSIPIVNIGDTIEECEGIPIILNAANPGLSYLWNTSEVSQTISVNSTGLYYVTVSLLGTSCSSSDSAFIQIYPRFNLGLPNQQVCSMDSIGIGINQLPGVNYGWSPSTNLNNPNIGNPIFSGINTGATGTTFTYYLAIDSAGFTCSYDTVIITLNPNPLVILPDTTVLCENNVVNLDAGVTLASYLWNTGANTQTISVNSTGIYGVIATYPTTCYDSDSTIVILDSLPHFIVQDVTVCDGDSAVLFVNPNEGNSFLWSTFETTPSIYTFTPGIYTLTVGNNCGFTTNTAEVFFKPNLNVINLPNVLTLNDDGVNDVYDIPILNSIEYPYRLDFFDRWGVLLYTCEDITQPWKGTSGANGEKVVPGTYFVVAHFVNCNGEEIDRKQFITVF